MSAAAGSPRLQKAVVRYAYEAEDANQLALPRVGDIVTIHRQDSEDWWDGEDDRGNRGYLPAKYVELLEFSIPSYDAAGSLSADDDWERRAGVFGAAPVSLGGSSMLMQNLRHTSSASLHTGGTAGHDAPLLAHASSNADFGESALLGSG